MKRFLPLLALSACTVGPDYRPPEAAAPAAFAASQGSTTAAIPADWWTLFGDRVLDDLVARALKDSPDIATAASRVRQARLQEVIAGAAGKPTVNASAGASRIEFSKNAGFATLAQQFSGGGGTGEGAPNGLGLPGTGISTFSLGFDAAWELDLFGGARRGREAATARREAAEFGGQDAALTLAAEVASAYFQLRLAEVQLATVEEELERQQRGNQISANIARVGLVPETDVVRGRGSISATQARLEPLRAEIAVQRNAIATLLGQPPEGFVIPAATPALAVPAIPAGLPADLIRRRPDVRAAERRLAAATADIGVATADLYPKFQLTGVAQLISTALRTLFDGDSLQLTASGQASFPLLDWGRRRSTVKLREEDRLQAYEAWRAAVLTAYREVEDALVRLDAERRRNATLAAAVNDRFASARSTEAQYRTGFVAQDQLLIAEVNLLTSREDKAQSDDALRRQTVALVKALGGGWAP
ncbi:efflux transporter outer membrane subunit [Sphingomonas sp.]|uniref:efflux transporter outer membrane subunit n=1 Tax=Sphingomonas sp. TaxID=28214 RepID=UPI0035C86640